MLEGQSCATTKKKKNIKKIKKNFTHNNSHSLVNLIQDFGHRRSGTQGKQSKKIYIDTLVISPKSKHLCIVEP